MNLAKTNMILAGLAVVLAIPTLLTLRSEAAMFTELDEVPRLFPGFTPENVGVIVVGIPKPAAAPQPNPQNPAEPKPQLQYDMLRLMRSEKGWALGQGELQGAPVQQDRVEKMLLQHLQDVRYDREVLVAENASDEDLTRYGLDEAQAMVIKAADKTGQNVVAEMLVGKDANAGSADNVRGFYVRRRDNKDVVLYEGQFYKPGIKSEEWIDLTIQKLEAGKITHFSYFGPATGGHEVAFEKKIGSQVTWAATKAPEGVGAVRQQEVETMVQRFCALRAQEIKRRLQGANLGELGLVPPMSSVSATVKDDSGEKTWTLTIGNKVDDKNEFYVQSNESPFLMTMAQHMVTPFERNPKDLFDPSAEALKPGDGK